jgi:hypothetical protein
MFGKVFEGSHLALVANVSVEVLRLSPVKITGVQTADLVG